MGLIASPFELNKEDIDLDLSLDNMIFNVDKTKLIEFYSKIGFRSTKTDESVLYIH